MAIKIDSVTILQKWFVKVAKIADTQKISSIMYPLLGYIVLNMDEAGRIIVLKDRQAGQTTMMIVRKRPCSILRVYMDATVYTFIYEHGDDSIQVRKGTWLPGRMAKINDSTTSEELSSIFINWPRVFGAFTKKFP